MQPGEVLVVAHKTQIARPRFLEAVDARDLCRGIALNCAAQQAGYFTDGHSHRAVGWQGGREPPRGAYLFSSPSTVGVMSMVALLYSTLARGPPPELSTR